MALEAFTNTPTPAVPATPWTTLSSGINAAVTSLTVASAAAFPSSGQFRILIESELLLVTAGAGTTTWTVTRGAEGSTAASHLLTAGVYHVITAASLKNNPGGMTTSGDLPYLNSSLVPTRLGIGSANTVLGSDGSVPSWRTFVHSHQNAAGGGTLAEAALALTDVTTNNATTSAHGFLRKLSNVATEFLNGVGAFARPLPTGQIRLEDAGAVDLTGLTNSNAAMLAAVTAAKNAIQNLPYSLQSSNPSGAIEILLPAGNILITADKGMLGLEGMAATANGIKFRGCGKGITNIIFKPAGAGSLMEVDRWYNVQFEGISFHAATAGCTCFFGNTTHNAQRYRFNGVSWNLFKYDIRLAGSDNNSEGSITDWDSTGVEDAGAHFYTDASDASDQFLNWWWRNGTFWLTNASMIDSAKGGHYVVDPMDASAWGGGLSAPKKLFNFRGTSHAAGVCSFRASVRGEFSSAHAGLIYCEWPYGNVDVTCDASALAGTYTYGADFISIYYDQTDGPAYRFSGILAGGITVSHGNDYAHQHRILVDEATWMQKESPSDVVTYEESRVSFGTVNRPPVEFRRCRPFPGSYTDAFGAAGVAIWDCTIGYLGEAVQSTRRREVRIGGGFGAPATTEVITVLLPVGAIITSFEAISPSGASAEADGGTWTLATTDGSPVTIGTAVVSGAMSAGFNLTTPLTLPFLCSTTAKARVTVACTSVATANTKALLFIKGYW